jgi:integrase
MALDWKKTSKWWYARYTVNGKTKLVNLGVKIEGRRPESINGHGNEAFRRSRDRARIKHDECLAAIREKQNLQHLTERMIELKTGSPRQSVTLADLPEAWTKIPRRREPNERYAAQCQATLGRFADFIRERWPTVEDLDSVMREHALAFMNAEKARGVSPKTWNDTLKLLRGTFKHLQPEADAYRRYLNETPTRETETVFRKPFTPEELKAILDTAGEDDFIRPVIVAGVCTAMRKGDCCCLKWTDVDLDRRFITVKTAKTGKRAEIPIFDWLHEELQKHTGNGDKFCFPEQALMYLANPDGITTRVRRIMARAGFVDAETAKAIREGTPPGLPVLPPDETRRKGLEAIDKADMPDAKRERMRAVFNLYMDGKSFPLILRELALSKGSVSGYLNEVERMIGAAVIRTRKTPDPLPEIVRDVVNVERENGLRRASVRDFHSFRVTWITLALARGVKPETIRQVTGHTADDVMLRHYDQRSQEQLREQIRSAMPDFLTNGTNGNGHDRQEHARDIAERMTARTWKKDKARLLAILDGKV